MSDDTKNPLHYEYPDETLTNNFVARVSQAADYCGLNSKQAEDGLIKCLMVLGINRKLTFEDFKALVGRALYEYREALDSELPVV